MTELSNIYIIYFVGKINKKIYIYFSIIILIMSAVENYKRIENEIKA